MGETATDLTQHAGHGLDWLAKQGGSILCMGCQGLLLVGPCPSQVRQLPELHDGCWIAFAEVGEPTCSDNFCTAHSIQMAISPSSQILQKSGWLTQMRRTRCSKLVTGRCAWIALMDGCLPTSAAHTICRRPSWRCRN